MTKNAIAKKTAPRVAIVHDWLNGMRGGENVLEAIVELFPDAPIFTLLHEKSKVSPAIEGRSIQTSFFQKLKLMRNNYRYFLPLMPFAIEQFDFSEYDLIVSSSHCVAKGIKKRSDAVHISYVHAPMRYMWDRFGDYFEKPSDSLAKKTIAKFFRPYLQKWDRNVTTLERVDFLISNSSFISEQIFSIYGRTSTVVNPFVDLNRFKPISNPRRDFYLIFGALAPYKRIDIAIRAFNELNLPLKIAGIGQDDKLLRALAGQSIEFLGGVDDNTAVELMQNARGLVFPGLEDFGITPLEAMACGTPVIAYDKGGVLDSVTCNTGLFFNNQNMESLMLAIREFESEPNRFDPSDCRKQAEKFSRGRFQLEFSKAIADFFESKYGEKLGRDYIENLALL